jgi:hypothetical protein
MVAGPLAIAIGVNETLIIGASISALAILGSLMIPSVRNMQAKYTD